jgi:transketolase
MIPSPTLSDEQRTELEQVAFDIRRLTIEQVAWAQWGHIAGAVSMAELLAVLYFRELRLDPDDANWDGRDRLVLSKAHTSPGLYAALALRGHISIDDLYEYCEIDGILEGHTDASRTPGVETSGGLLGMGLSVAQGMALGMRFSGNSRGRVYCILGDGELNEGNIWEAAMSAAHLKLDNLIAILDHNKIMAKDFVANQMGIEPVADKFRAFGWTVLDVDGHDLDAVARVLYEARWVIPVGQPILIIANTVKGRGILDAEGSAKWHTHAPKPPVAEAMLAELAEAYGRESSGYSRGSQAVKREVFDV